MREDEWGGGEVATSAEHLRAACASWTRLEILVALSRDPGDVSGLARRLRYSVGHVSAELRKLLAAGLVVLERRGKEHHYALSASTVVRRERAGPGPGPVTECLVVQVRAGDGSSVRWSIAASSPLIRLVDAPSASR